ncbi:MAG: pilin [Candidatus Moraniibacteriota bacterium]
MQKKKYLFGVVFIISIFVGVLGLGKSVDAFSAGATCCINDVVVPNTCSECVAADGSDCMLSAMGGSCPRVAVCTDPVCLPTTCCYKAGPPIDCQENAPNCTGGTTYNSACSAVGACNGSSPTGTDSTSTTFINPITSNSISDVLGKLMSALSGLVITLSIIFIVLGGILYMLSAGDPGMIKRAKDCWLFSVIGLAIVVAAPTFLKEVMAILGGTLQDDTLTSALTITEIATNVMNFLLSIVGIIAIISLVIAGGMYMTAYGDDTQMGKAKKMAMWAVVGIAVALGSLVLVKQVADLIAG